MSLTQSDTTVKGNTKKPLRSRNWFLTFNGYGEIDVTQVLDLGTECIKYMMQEEKGENGNKHLQGVFIFKNPRYFDALKKGFPKAHWEVCKDVDAAIKYCSKDETRDGKRWYKGIVMPKEYDWRPHQKAIIDLYKSEPAERKIIWYWDEQGNTGKTTVAKYLCTKYKDVMFVSGKAADIKCGVALWLTKVGPLRMVIMGLTRTNEHFVSYEALEAVQDGIFFSGKYESGMVIMEKPHVVVLANFEPNMGAISADKWDVRKI